MAGLATATCTVRGIRGSLAKRFSALPVTQISRGNDIFFFSIATSVQITKPPSHPIGFLDTILQRLQGCGQPLTYSRATAEILDHVRQTQINDFGSLIKILHGFSVANYWPVGLFEAAACVIQMNGQHLDYTQWSDALVAFAIPQFYHQEMIITCLQYICECSTKEGDMVSMISLKNVCWGLAVLSPACSVEPESGVKTLILNFLYDTVGRLDHASMQKDADVWITVVWCLAVHDVLPLFPSVIKHLEKLVPTLPTCLLVSSHFQFIRWRMCADRRSELLL
eukprot:GHVQ01025876.1.p1 GENE.GHVQ01025876.1~~GHVQ01025876.1.p1  ORF type:complete len:303 (-),score=19.20 GHVQ01025876.1:2531-3373(-)